MLGVRSVSDMGTLTTSPSGLCDETIINRSSTLLPDFYGPFFSYRHYARARNAFVGAVLHYAFTISLALLLLPPVRWLVRRFVYRPGQGPAKEETRNDRVEFRVIATVDQNKGKQDKPKRVLGSLSFQGSAYELTGVTVSEAARVILEHEDEIRKISGGGGMVTTATLGQNYVDGLVNGGCRIETKLLDG
jgi:short subunit dehydrogenase-like uncharacterized protein